MYVVFTTAYIIWIAIFCLVLLYRQDYVLLSMVASTIGMMAVGLLLHRKFGLTQVSKVISFLVLHFMIALAYIYYDYGPQSFLSIILALLPSYSILVTERAYHRPLQIGSVLYTMVLYFVWGAVHFDAWADFWADGPALYITLMTAFLGGTLSMHLDTILHLLERQNEELEVTHKKLGVFLSDVSHQIKTPMNGIMGIQNLLETTDAEDEKSELFEILRHSSMNMLRDMNNIMELSKIEGDLVNIFTEYFRIDDIIEDTQYMYDLNIFNKKQTIHYAPNGRTYFGDKSKVKLIIENILDHIFATNEESKVRIAVSTDSTLRLDIKHLHEGTKLVIEDASFSEVSISASSLGIYMATNLAKLLKGKLDIYEDSEATHYALELPYMALVDNEVEKWHHRPKQKIENVLLVEDNAVSRKIIAAHFENREYKITSTVNGLEALEYIKHNYDNIDVIFMDIQMPIMDGITATKKIREWEYKYSNQMKPIIALTANTMFEDKLMCYSSGINYFIGKPFNPKKIELLLQKIETNKAI